MSERDTLKATLPPDVHDDIDTAFEGKPADDPRDIVAELHRQGLLDAGQLKDAVMALESRNKIRQVSRKPPATVDAPQILGMLGAGAMGEVLIAKDKGLNRVVAVKRIHPDAAKNKSMMRRFYTEAQITAQLDHPSIVPIHGLVHDEAGGLAYAMKLVRGRTLEEYLDGAAKDLTHEEHTLPARLERFLHVCDAMAYAHERGIVHRDLKPENVMVGAFGEVLVMDWGIAKVLSHRDDPAAEEEEPPEGEQPAPKKHRGTKVGRVMGTPRYMSPEQAEGRNDIIDARSDQYALGLILQEIVTLIPGIPGEMDLAGCLGWAQQGKRAPMKGYPRELVAIVDKACAKKPDDRYPSVAAFSEDIRRYLRDEAPLAAPDGLFGKLQRWIGRHRRTALMLIVGSVGGLVVVGTSLLALGGSAIAAQQYMSQVRETQLTNVLHRAMDRANGIDSQLHDIERLTTGLAFAADAAMDRAPPRLSYNVMTEEPPGGLSAGKYGKVSTRYASVGSTGRATKDDLERLAGLGTVMSRAMVSTTTGDARKLSHKDLANQLGNKKNPVLWSRVGLRTGEMAEAPGSVGYRRDLPPNKKREWFMSPKDGRGAAWSEPHLDPNGLGLVITCMVPFFDDDGTMEGIATIDVDANWMTHRMRAIKGADTYLVDRQGRVMLSSKSDPKKKPSFDPLPHEQHRDAITHGRAGWHEAGGSLAVWSPLTTTGWTWVVVASSDVLRENAGEAIDTN